MVLFTGCAAVGAGWGGGFGLRCAVRANRAWEEGGGGVGLFLGLWTLDGGGVGVMNRESATGVRCLLSLAAGTVRPVVSGLSGRSVVSVRGSGARAATGGARRTPRADGAVCQAQRTAQVSRCVRLSR